MKNIINRREFLKLTGSGLFSLAFLNPSLLAQTKEDKKWDRLLVLVELRGGNDGLNTVVPYGDKLYYKNRPKLAIPAKNVLKLNHQLGLHPSLAPLMELWKQKELAIVSGVGYPKPNHSHFRSIAIWETGSKSHEFLNNGWISRVFAGGQPSKTLPADSIILDRGQEGPLSGKNMRNILFTNPDQFIRQASQLKEVSAKNSHNPSLLHLVQIQQNLLSAAKMLQKKLAKAPALGVKFPRRNLGNQLAVAARLLSVSFPAPVIKVSMGGFDNHSGQKFPHLRLLRELSQSLAAFRLAMKKIGIWDRVTVMTYSEFGRRVRENGSQGTDHGTAAPHFLLGGKVQGGLFGKQPSLSDLDRGDLKHTVDYRSLYLTLARKWWKVSDTFLSEENLPVLECL